MAMVSTNDMSELIGDNGNAAWHTMIARCKTCSAASAGLFSPELPW